MDIGSSFNHLHFRDVVCPSGVLQKFCDLTTEIEDCFEQRSIYRQSIVVSFVGPSTSLWILCKFELESLELQS